MITARDSVWGSGGLNLAADGGESSYHFDLQSCIKLGAKTRVVLPHFSDAGRIFLLYDV